MFFLPFSVKFLFSPLRFLLLYVAEQDCEQNFPLLSLGMNSFLQQRQIFCLIFLLSLLHFSEQKCFLPSLIERLYSLNVFSNLLSQFSQITIFYYKNLEIFEKWSSRFLNSILLWKYWNPSPDL